MSDLRAQSLAVLDLTRAILAAAEAAGWDEVAALEERRRQALERLFSGPLRGEADAVLLADLIEQVREMDRTVVELARRERDAVAAELTRLRGARRHERAYRDVAEAGL
jgi:hypothetical protein